MMSEFTPGPWKHSTTANIGNLILGPTGRKSYAGDDGYRSLATVQTCGQFPDHDSEEANQRANIALIAAAPTMYAALEAAEKFLIDEFADSKGNVDNEEARAALAKVRAARAAADGRDAEETP